MLEQLQRDGAHWSELANATTRSDIALIYDYANSWAQGSGGVGEQDPRYGEIQSFYTGLKSLRQISTSSRWTELAGYKVVAASNLRLIDDATVDRLKAFVKAGGTLVLNYRVATQNMDNSMRLTLAPGPFAEIAGVQVRGDLDLFEYNSQNGNLDANLQAGLGIRLQEARRLSARAVRSNLSRCMEPKRLRRFAAADPWKAGRRSRAIVTAAAG